MRSVFDLEQNAWVQECVSVANDCKGSGGGGGGGGDASAANQTSQITLATTANGLLTTGNTYASDANNYYTTNIGVASSASASSDTGTFPLISLIKRIASKTATLGTAGSPATTVLSVQGVASGTALAVSMAAVPTGAATAAKQPALGTAGSASADVITVQGIASGVPQPTAGITTNPSANFTRPNDTTPYSVADLVANNTTNTSVVAMTLAAGRVNGGSFMLRRAKLMKSGTSLTLASFRLHFYKVAPTTVTNGDNAAYNTSGAGDYLGAMDVSCDVAFTDGAVGYGVPVSGTEINGVCGGATTNIFCLIEARAGYTPTALEVFTVVLEDLQN